MYGEVWKCASKNSATFKMELSATISNGRKLQRALSDGLTTNWLLKFAKHLSCQTHLDARFYKKVVYTVFKEYMIKKLKRKTPERRQLTVCSCQLTSFWCLSLLILGMFHTVFVFVFVFVFSSPFSDHSQGTAIYCKSFLSCNKQDHLQFNRALGECC